MAHERMALAVGLALGLLLALFVALALTLAALTALVGLWPSGQNSIRYSSWQTRLHSGVKNTEFGSERMWRIDTNRGTCR